MPGNVAFTLLESLAFGALLSGNVWLLWRQRRTLWQAIAGAMRRLPPPDRPPPETLSSLPARKMGLKSPPLPLAA